jgi:hypothetical protein
MGKTCHRTEGGDTTGGVGLGQDGGQEKEYETQLER